MVSSQRFVVSLVSLSLVAALGCASESSDGMDADMDAGTDAMVSRPDTAPPPRMDAGPPLPRYPGLPIGCWIPRNSFCNPANNQGCAAGEACDVAGDAMGRPIIQCFPPPADQGLGEACNNDTGPFCEGGLRCMSGQCMDTCCDRSECAAGERCVPLDPGLGSLGVCAEDDGGGGTCARPGAFCGTNADCCSNICHIGHCH
ncbi:MAG: hypothetical protein AAGE52_31945 [Myxococcota bacterium]